MTATSKVLILPAAILASMVVVSSAQERASIKQVFESDQYLAEAAKNILNDMDYAELSALRDYFAECQGQFSSNELIQHSCNVSKEKYRLEYERQRPIDRLLSAVEVVTELERLSEKAKRKSDPNNLLRLITIKDRLKDVMILKFEILRSDRKRSRQ